MDFSIHSKMEEYYQKFIELQDKLRKSEEERMKLELKFQEIVQTSKEEEQAHYRKLRAQYKSFLEEDRKRQDRNERIIRNLERIETKITMLSAKTERFNILRRQYQDYLQRILQVRIADSKPMTLPSNLAPRELSSTTAKSDESYQPSRSIYNKTPAEVGYLDQSRDTEEKMEILDKYLESISSRRCRDLLESERKARESLLPESSRVKFDANKANSVAEDIMNSIYSRFYNKENALPDSQPNQLVSDFVKNSRETYGDINREASKSFKIHNDSLEQQDLSKKYESKTFNDQDEDKQHKDEEDNEKNRNQEQDSLKQNNEHKEEKFEINMKDRDDLIESKDQTLEGNISLPSHTDHIDKLQVDNTELTNEIETTKSKQEIVNQNKHTPADQYENQNNEQLTQPFNLPSREQDPDKDDDGEIEATKGKKISIEMKENEDEHELPGTKTEEQSFDTNAEIIKQGISKNDGGLQHLNSNINNEQAPSEAENQVSNSQPIGLDLENEQGLYDDSGQRLHYDESGQLLQYDDGGQPIQYDENGLPVQYNPYDQTVQYEQYGQPLLYDENGQPVSQNYGTGMELQYDENGQVVPQYDENGQLIPQYGQNGQVIPQYDENGQMILQYDESGQVIPQYDENGQLLQQFQEYDQPYDTYGQEMYDENGQLLANYNNNDEIVQQNEQYLEEYEKKDDQLRSEELFEQNNIQNEVDANKQPINPTQDDSTKMGEVTLQEEKEDQQHSDVKEISIEEKLAVDINIADEVKVVEGDNLKDPIKPSNVLQMLDTDSESVKQNTSKISNDSDFEFSNG